MLVEWLHRAVALAGDVVVSMGFVQPSLDYLSRDIAHPTPDKFDQLTHAETDDAHKVSIHGLRNKMISSLPTQIELVDQQNGISNEVSVVVVVSKQWSHQSEDLEVNPWEQLDLILNPFVVLSGDLEHTLALNLM